MRRFIGWIVGAVMLLYPAALLAAGYEIEGAYGTQVIPLSDGGALAMHLERMNMGELPESVVRWESDGRCTLRVPLEQTPQGQNGFYGSRTPIAFSNGRCGLLEKTDGVAVWREITQDGLAEARELARGVREIAGGVDGLALTLEKDGAQSILLLDAALERRTECPMPEGGTGVFRYTAEDGADTLLLTTSKAYAMLVVRLDGAGNLIWQCPVEHCNRMVSDGQGGVFVSGSPEENYKIERMVHIDAQGNLDGEWVLRAQNAILSTHCARAGREEGTITFYGSVVAQSRGLFDAFALTMDLDGQVRSLDVRDFSEREDYGFSCVAAPDGEIYVYLSAEGFGTSERKNALLVPFEALEPAGDPGITLR